ncbi:hypothetical protein [Sediminibacterium sp.]|uniref:hypothetical protein n=1 Tax=Sediminibacterium sp. TaxID=1917865 RepID=UPI002731D14A|nr:hypothetical protein [Sediminibacterium sp.]MDP2421332.1 hypothetical protein [Sediminibacterium sp.]
MDVQKIIQGLEAPNANEHELTVLRGSCDQYADDPAIHEIYDHYQKKVERIDVTKQLPMFEPALADAWKILSDWKKRQDGL